MNNLTRGTTNMKKTTLDDHIKCETYHLKAIKFIRGDIDNNQNNK